MNPLLLALVLSLAAMGFAAWAFSSRTAHERRSLRATVALAIGGPCLVAGIWLGLDTPLGALGLVLGVGGVATSWVMSARRRRKIQAGREEERRALAHSGMSEGAVRILELEDRVEELRILPHQVGVVGLFVVMSLPILTLGVTMGDPTSLLMGSGLLVYPAYKAVRLLGRWREGRKAREELDTLLTGPDERPPSSPGGS